VGREKKKGGVGLNQKGLYLNHFLREGKKREGKFFFPKFLPRNCLAKTGVNRGVGI